MRRAVEELVRDDYAVAACRHFCAVGIGDPELLVNGVMLPDAGLAVADR